jgi:CubicO group peptidase (beta-lactamase class C family)
MNKRGFSISYIKKIFPIITVSLIIVFPGHGEQPFNLKELLDSVRKNYSIPGLSAAIVIDGEVTAEAFTGIRKAGLNVPVTAGDAFMLCSVTKPLTATLANILSEKKILSIKSKIADVFPELADIMQPEYREVTIELLLSHRSGMPYQPKTEPGDEYLSVSSDLMKRRYEYVKSAVIDKPEADPGRKMIYGGGTIIVAAMMEKKTGKPWEKLVRDYIFMPLGIKTAGFGAMSEAGGATGVWEHTLVKNRFQPEAWPATYSSEVHAPAGRNVHMSAGDLAKFMIASFPYCVKGTRLLSPGTIIQMQQQAFDGPTSAGWFSTPEQWSDWKTVWHSGDNGKSLSALVFSQKYNTGFVLMANISGKKANDGFGVLNEKIKEYLAKEIAARKIIPHLPSANRSLSYRKPSISSDVYYNMNSYSSASCFDGILDTRWATNSQVQDAWIEVDLQKVCRVQSFFIREEFYPRVSSFSISAKSDEKEEFRVITKGGKLGEGLVINVPKFTARYIRLTVHTDGSEGPTLSEFQVFSDRTEQVPVK